MNKRGTAARYCDKKTIHLKVLLQKKLEIMTRSSPASLVLASYGIPHAVEDFCQVDPQHHLSSLSSLKKGALEKSYVLVAFLICYSNTMLLP